ncbi:ESPR-type extended signal peptide-containing protein [Stenotrophomonas sp. LGBM10]|uniref:ESPR-type extended signal peptide-containing protein n=1 Tax=Stenotrophomonas sp. LGBM10 TaxID=3390038 RepID=UPI00398BB231
MNRIYRLIWNTTLRCWSVASEHTRSRGKPASATCVLGAALCVMLAGPAVAAEAGPDPDNTVEAEPAATAEDDAPGAPGPVQDPLSADVFDATAIGVRGAGINSQNVLIGGGTSINSTRGVAIGVGSTTAFDGVGIGANAKANAGGVAIGIDAATSVGSGGTAIGRNARSDAQGGTGAVALGMNSYVGVSGNSAVAIGSSARAEGSNATALGAGAQASGTTSIAVGNNAKAPARGAIVIGDGGTLANANAHHAIVIGSGARSGGYDAGIAIGQNAVTDGSGKAVALGAQANASHGNAVALGAGSVTTATNQVSVGNATTKRKIVNVADAALSTTSTEAVTGKQLHATNQNVTSAINTANGARTTANDALAKANAASGLISQTAANGNVRLGGSNTGATLDVRNQSNANRRITGVADGALSTSSTEAVTGKQLHATNQNVAGVTTTANAAKVQADALAARLSAAALAFGAEAAAAGDGAVAIGRKASAPAKGAIVIGDGGGLDNGNAYHAVVIGTGARSGGYASGVAIGHEAVTGGHGKAVALGAQAVANHTNSVALGAGSTSQADNQVSVGNATLKRRIVNVGDGSLSTTSSEAVTGRQLHATNQNVSAATTLANTAHSIANDAQTKANVLGGLLSQSAGNGDVRVGASNTGGAVDMRNQSNASRRVTGVADAALGTGSTDAVSGRQLHATNQNVATVTATAATLGGLVGQTAANGTVRLGAQNTGTTLDVRNQANANRRISGVADGVVSASSADAVSGRQLNTTNQNVTAATTLANTAHTVANSAQTTANDAQSKANVLGGLLSQAAADGDMRLGAGNSGGVLDARNQNNQARRIRGVAEGVLNATSDEAVSGRQLFASNAQIARNREDIDSLRSDFADFDPDLSDVVRFDEEGNVSLDGGRLIALAEGDLSAGSREAVTGGQLFVTNARVSVLEEANKYAAVGYDEWSEAAQAGLLATAMGSDTLAMGEGATAVGSFAQARGKNSVSLGRAALVHEEAENGFALGARSQVHVLDGVALGSSAEVREGASQSVALGAWSVAQGPNEVSLGHGTLKRRVTNAANGIQGSDLTTVDQLAGVINALGGGARFAADGSVIAPSYSVQGVAHGTVGDALGALDAEVTGTQHGLDAVGERLHALDQARAASDATAVRFDANRGAVDFGGAMLINVANGMIAPGSRDAVNGGQLHAVQEQINGRIDGLQSQIDGPAAADNRQASVDDTAVDEAPADAQVPETPAKDAPAVASADAPKPGPTADDPPPAVDSRAVDEAVNQANAYTDQAMAGVDRKLDRMDKRLNRMAAMGSAQAAMAMNTAGLNTYNRLGAGVGHAEGESALAVGYQRVLNERGSATFSLNGAFTNSGERTLGVGFGVGW